MNLVQMMRKSRLNVDAVLPGGTVSTMWVNEEIVDTINEAYEEVYRRFRRARKKWGMLTLKQTDAAFTRDGESWDPSVNLKIGGGTANTASLPPDFGELVRILCLSDRSVRFLPAEAESFHWISLELAAQDNAGNVLASTPWDLTIYYDIIGSRTLIFNPPVSTSYNLQLDYIPMLRPLYYSANGTVTVTGTTLTGVSTTWVTDNIFTEASGQSTELITGTSDPTTGVALNQDYPRVSAIASNTSGTMKLSTTVAGGTSAILSMAPALPREYHRGICSLASAFMLRKINPNLSDQYVAEFWKRFGESIRPTAGVRQTQESPITEDSEEMGIIADWR